MSTEKIATQVATVPAAKPSETTLSVFGSEAGFIAGQRMANMLSKSSLVPDAYRGEAGLPNAIIAVDMPASPAIEGFSCGFHGG